MIIETTGTHIIPEDAEKIEVRCPELVILIDTPKSKTVERIFYIHTNTTCHLYGHIENNYKAKIINQGETSNVQLRYIIAGQQKSEQEIDITGSIQASQCVSDIYILSLITEASHIKLNGVVHIDSNIEKAGGHILEENIFLGSKGKITGIPSLLVHSNDVQASHAARIERIPDEKLYYLRARGIPKDDATVMMIDSSISTVLDGLPEEAKQTMHEQIFAQIFSETNQ